eukprot:COSAG01_NODE_23573_length_810_cov_1.232068_1_plen_100_part_10
MMWLLQMATFSYTILVVNAKRPPNLIFMLGVSRRQPRSSRRHARGAAAAWLLIRLAAAACPLWPLGSGRDTAPPRSQDEVGWNNVGFHNNGSTISPNLDG